MRGAGGRGHGAGGWQGGGDGAGGEAGEWGKEWHGEGSSRAARCLLVRRKLPHSTAKHEVPGVHSVLHAAATPTVFPNVKTPAEQTREAGYSECAMEGLAVRPRKGDAGGWAGAVCG